jgi:hypothetical protein
MFNWLERRRQIRTVKLAKEDLERFLDTLKGLSDEEVGELLATSVLMRQNLDEQGIVEWGAMSIEAPLQIREDAARSLRSIFRMWQQKNTDASIKDAGSLMLWIQSLTALNFPETRIQGREIWAEISRGFDFSEISAARLEMVTGVHLKEATTIALRSVPKGLEPKRD